MSPARAPRRSMLQIVLLAVAFLVLVAISIASLYWLQRAREDASWVAHTLEVENQISLALLQIRRAESAERGYLLTEQRRFPGGVRAGGAGRVARAAAIAAADPRQCHPAAGADRNHRAQRSPDRPIPPGARTRPGQEARTPPPS